jgi:hypothetical protein
MGGSARRGVLTSLALLGLVATAYPGAARATTAPAERAAATARNGGPASGGGAMVRKAADAADDAARPPAGAAMPLAGWRLPPPGYLDYCLRFRDRDQACAW